MFVLRVWFAHAHTDAHVFKEQLWSVCDQSSPSGVSGSTSAALSVPSLQRSGREDSDC